MAISWMQKHKKWLVITIWISTIAFVGAGFVGWGSYEFGKSGGSAGSVGDREIEIKDIQNEYSKLYNQYQQMFGASFNNEMADKLNLQSLALNNTIQKYLLLNLADEYGIEATDKEIAQALVQYEPFLKDGKFDKDQYIKALKLNRSNPNDFEADLQKNISIDKLTKVLVQEVNEQTLNNISNLFFAEDKIAINIINAKELNLNYTQDDIKKFFEENQNNYKSKKEYRLSISKIQINNEDEKSSRKEALKLYLKAKKGETILQEKLVVDESTILFTTEDLEKIFEAKVGDFIKPLKTKDNYIVAKLEEIKEPYILPYEKVATDVKKDFLDKLTQKELESAKAKVIEKFTGTEIGYVSKGKTETIKGLTKEETQTFLNELFVSKNQIGDVTLADKVVVFKILDSKLVDAKEQNKLLKQNIEQIMNNEILTNLIKKLNLRYQVDSRI